MNDYVREKLLRRLDADEAGREAIDRELWEEFGKEVTVFISDMTGFSRITKEYGINHFLSMIAKKQIIVPPIIEKFGGRTVKSEADNVFAVFESPSGALQASGEIHRELQAFNEDKPKNSRIIACHGIAQGEVLDLGDDIYGHPVNMASKLGEDVANDYETLLTERVKNAIGEVDEFDFEERKITVSGVEISYFSVAWFS